MSLQTLRHYYPHTLLLMGSFLCVTLALLGPTQTHTQPNPSGQRASALSQAFEISDRNAYPRTYTSNLADLLREARSKVMRMRMLKKFEQAEEIQEDQWEAIAQDPQQRRMVRRFDQRNMLEIVPLKPAANEEYAFVTDPLVWRRPDALPPREYTVLGYGEIRNEPLDESQSLDEQAQTDQTLPTNSIEDLDGQVFALTEPAAPDTTTSHDLKTDPVIVPPVRASRPAISVPAQPVVTLTAAIKPSAPAANDPPAQTTPTPAHRTPQPAVPLSRDMTPDAKPLAPTARPAAIIPAVIASKPSKHGDDDDHSPATKPLAPTARPIAFTPKAIASKPLNSGEGDDNEKPVAKPRVPTVRPVAFIPTSVDTKQLKHGDDDDTSADAPGRPVFTPPAKTPLVSLPSRPVITRTQDKHESDDTPTLNNRPTPAPPVLANKPVIETRPTTPQYNQPDPIVVYVEDHEEIGGDKLNAIRNAIGRINNDTDLPVQLELTTDSSRAYDIRFREDDSDDLGNKLGITTTAYTEDSFGNQTFLRPGSSPGLPSAINVPEITLNSSFNWFTGNDANDIGDNEYDYETAVSHEYLHALGMGDDFDNNNAVSYGLLSPGETRREFDDNDQNELADLYKDFNPGKNQQVISIPSRENGHRKDKDHDKDLKIRYKTQALTAAVPEPVSALVVAAGALVGMLKRRR